MTVTFARTVAADTPDTATAVVRALASMEGYRVKTVRRVEPVYLGPQGNRFRVELAVEART